MTEQHIDIQIAVVLCSFLSFSFLIRKLSDSISQHVALYRGLSTMEKVEWNDRNNSTTHAVIASVLSSIVAVLDQDGYDNPLWGGSWFSKAVLCFSVGYVLSDTLFILLYLPTTIDAYWGTLAHHLCMACCYTICVVYGVYVHLCIVRTLAEFSTPLVNTRWILAKCKMQKTKAYVYNGCLMALVFFIFRIVAMPYCYMRIYEQRNTAEFERLGNFTYCLLCGVFVDVLNVIWFIKIFRGMIKYLTLASVDSKRL